MSKTKAKMKKPPKRNIGGLIIGIVLALVIVGGIIYLISLRDSAVNKPADNMAQPPVENSQPTIIMEYDSGGSTVLLTPSEEDAAKKEESEPAVEPEDEKETEEDASASEKQTEKTEEKKPEQPREQKPVYISFPYTIPNSTLRVDAIHSYDGLFVEDGSDVSVSGIAVMTLRNLGSQPLEYVSITVKQGERALTFTASDVVAGGLVLVEEANAAPYSSAEISSCTAEAAELDALTFASEISVEENEDGALVITNVTEQDIPMARIFYKLYIEEADTYVGGITYTSKLTNLHAGDSVTITPSHYAPGYSRIVMTRVYDSAE